MRIKYPGTTGDGRIVALPDGLITSFSLPPWCGLPVLPLWRVQNRFLNRVEILVTYGFDDVDTILDISRKELEDMRKFNKREVGKIRNTLEKYKRRYR